MLINYLGQLRIYSYVDLCLLFLAANASIEEFSACSLLWFGFLIHLEWRHKDIGRRRWSVWIWIVLWILAIVLLKEWKALIFIALAVTYAFKKRFPIGIASSVINGMLKASFVYIIVGFEIKLIFIVLFLMALRNLAGDIRDAEKDAQEDVITLPVFLGYKKHTPYIYPVILTLTSTAWILVGGLPLWIAPAVWLVQVSTYHLTPR